MATKIIVPQYNITATTKAFFSRIVTDSISSLDTDSAGNVYITSLNTSGSPQTIYNAGGSTLKNLVNSNGYLIKFNSAGVYQWSRALYGDPLGTLFCTVDKSSSNVYISGWANGGVWINDGETNAGLAGFGGSNGTFAYMAKIGTNGNFIYGRSLFGLYGSYGGPSACDSTGSVYMLGAYGSTTTKVIDENFNTLASLPNPRGTGTGPPAAAFCVKFNSSGTYQYARIVDSTTDDVTFRAACDASNNLYMAGNYSSTPNIIAVTATSTFSNVGNLPAASGSAIFVVKFNSTGTLQYSRIFDSANSDDTCWSVSCDSSSNVYVGGNYTGALTIKAVTSANVPSNIGTFNAPAYAEGSGFVTKFNSAGALQYSRLFNGQYGTVYDIGQQAASNIYCFGSYSSSMNVIYVTNLNVHSNVSTFPSDGSNSCGFCAKFSSDGTIQYGRIIKNGGVRAGTFDSTSSSAYMGGRYTGTQSIIEINGTPLAYLATREVPSGFITKFLASP